jgi:hypothetical protein
MKISVHGYNDQGETIKKTTVSNLINNTINNSNCKQDKTEELLGNLIEVLAEKNIISLNDIADKILYLDNYNKDRPAIQKLKE